METKNKAIVVLLLATIISFSFSMYYQIKYGQLEYGNRGCWLWVIDDNGYGFGDVINHCPQTRYNCESGEHNLQCKWVESRNLVDTEGNKLGKTAEGCECRLGSKENLKEMIFG